MSVYDESRLSLVLDRPRRHLLDQAATWGALHDDERRRRAIEAARDKDSSTLWSLTEAYIASMTTVGVTVSPHTHRAYRTGIRQFLTHAEANAWNLLRPRRADAALWLAGLSAGSETRAPLKPASVRARVAAASALYAALRWADATDAHPFEDLRLPRERSHSVSRRPPYRSATVHRAVAAAERAERTDLKLLVLLTAHGGLRIGEALALTWAEVDLDARRMTIGGKGGRTRIVGLSGSLLEAFLEHRGSGATFSDRRSTGPRLFSYRHRSGALYHLRRLMEAEGLTWSGFHAYRKYCGTLLYTRTRDFTRVANHLGHADVNTTRLYVQVPADDLAEELADL